MPGEEVHEDRDHQARQGTATALSGSLKKDAEGQEEHFDCQTTEQLRSDYVWGEK